MDTALVNWLLDSKDPAVRHATLITLLGRPLDGPEVRQSREAMMESAPVRTILDRQHPDGYWDRPGGFYNRKYRGTVWQVIFLAQLGADPADERIRRACEFLFARSQNRDHGGFVISSNRDHSGGAKGNYPCLTGNLVRALHHFGYIRDPRWQHAVDWLLASQHDDGGWSHGPICGHSCFQGSIKPLLALTAIAPADRSLGVEKGIERAVAFLLQHRLFKRDHHGFDVAKRGHLRLRFPLGWQTDVLDLLDGVTAAGRLDDPRMADALAVVLSKRDSDGRWPLEETFPASGQSSMWCRIETKGRPSKWVTLRTLRVLERVGQSTAERLALMAEE